MRNKTHSRDIYEVVETKEALEIINKALSDTEVNIYITDGGSERKILLDAGAITLLKAHYKSKSMWGAKVNG